MPETIADHNRRGHKHTCTSFLLSLFYNQTIDVLSGLVQRAIVRRYCAARIKALVPRRHARIDDSIAGHSRPRLQFSHRPFAVAIFVPLDDKTTGDDKSRAKSTILFSSVNWIFSASSGGAKAGRINLLFARLPVSSADDYALPRLWLHFLVGDKENHFIRQKRNKQTFPRGISRVVGK